GLELQLDRGEDFGQRGRGEHGQRALAAARRLTGHDEERRHRHEPRSHLGRPTTTLVAFTDATTWTPGRNPSSSTLSAVVRATRRNGPACISTVAAALSATTSVTTASI